MGSTWVWWDQAPLCSAAAVGIFLINEKERASAVMYQTEVRPREYTYMCLNAISRHFSHRSVFVGEACCWEYTHRWEYTWNKERLWRLRWFWASSLSVVCLALEREKTDACLFLYYLWGGSFVWFPRSWGSCILCCLSTLLLSALGWEVQFPQAIENARVWGFFFL